MCETFQKRRFQFMSPFKCHLRQFNQSICQVIQVFSRCFFFSLPIPITCFRGFASNQFCSFPQKVVPDFPWLSGPRGDASTTTCYPSGSATGVDLWPNGVLIFVSSSSSAPSSSSSSLAPRLLAPLPPSSSVSLLFPS